MMWKSLPNLTLLCCCIINVATSRNHAQTGTLPFWRPNRKSNILQLRDVVFRSGLNWFGEWNYISLVFTKSVNGNFRAFWLAPVTQNILGSSLFCDRSQDGVSFRAIFGRRNLCDKWSNRTKKIPRKRWNLACRCLLVGRKLFSCWICNKIIKCTWQNPQNVCKL